MLTLCSVAVVLFVIGHLAYVAELINVVKTLFV